MEAAACHPSAMPSRDALPQTPYAERVEFVVELAAHLRVPLTTVRQPTCRIGELGAEKLIEKIETQSDQTVRMVIKPELVLRQST